MSDYLNNLVARAFGWAPTVQPRLTSLFEPVSAPTNILTRVPLETEETVAALSSAAPIVVVPVTAAVPKNKAQTPPQAGWQSEPDQKEIIGKATGQNPEQGMRDVVQRPFPIPEPPRTSQNVSAAPVTPDPPDRITPRDVERPAVVAQIQTLRGDVSVSGEDADGGSWPEFEPRVRQLIDNRLGSLRSESAANRQQVDHEVTSEAQPPRSVTRTAAADNTSMLRPRQTVTNFAPPAEPPQTISVTIGRVDVRAIFAPQAPRRSTSPGTTAVNSLDDYLKQRSEGRR